ncbi:fibronectin type III domain-containing protein [Streptomyces macrosporus]|uniref:Fibronectin type III domain-containing protein n=1 Tax=Streptomyces macrosporus TaxID=44032 RepID=A0ABP5WT13_9ACTN
MPVVACLLLAACGPERGDARPPSAPTGVTAQAGSATSVHVMWNRSTDDTGVAGYEVHRSGKKVEDVPGERHMVDVEGLKPSTAHTFTVRARDAAGNLSPFSAEVSVTTPPRTSDDRTPPTRPERPRGRAEGARAATLTWERSTDDRGVASYDILQGGTRIHRVAGDETTALVTGLRPGVRYTFTVVARDAADNASPASRAVRITTAGAGGESGGPGTAPSDFRAVGRAADDGYHIDLSWVPPKTGGRITRYRIHLDGELATTLNWSAPTPRERVSYSLYAGKEPGITHTVRIRAMLPDGTWGALSEKRTVTLGER